MFGTLKKDGWVRYNKSSIGKLFSFTKGNSPLNNLFGMSSCIGNTPWQRIVYSVVFIYVCDNKVSVYYLNFKYSKNIELIQVDFGLNIWERSVKYSEFFCIYLILRVVD